MIKVLSKQVVRTKTHIRYIEYKIIDNQKPLKVIIKNNSHGWMIKCDDLYSYDFFIWIESILRGRDPKNKSTMLKGDYLILGNSIRFDMWNMIRLIDGKGVNRINPKGSIYRLDVLRIIKEWDKYFK